LPALQELLPGVPLVESPLFYSIIEQMGFSDEERRVAIELHEQGYALINFPDDRLGEKIERIQAHVSPQFDVDMTDPNTVKNSGRVQRVQDAWTYSEDVRAIAANATLLELLSKLYGRRAFPFQTLNFPVGTQQHLHSDSIHFSSIPERFMCGVWLAMEDIHATAGPLTYLPGSHKWPILSNIMIGRRGTDSGGGHAQPPFEATWAALVERSATKQETFLARKGQALIWAANLLHGGSPQTDPTRTRWSQVTHYYFDDCIYYTPAFSDEALGLLDLRTIVDVATEMLKPNLYLGKPIAPDSAPTPNTSFRARLRKRRNTRAGLPDDFDPDAYYRLNPDVAVAKLDPVSHYLRHGKAEGRRYRYRSR
jgi:Phytanoyl-CoA dioxygenase (PhyH)